MRRLLMLRTIGVGVLLALLTGPSFAQTNVGLPQRVCSQNIMCIINGVAYSPNTPKGYTCNNGYAAAVTTCHWVNLPQRALKQSGQPKPPTTPTKVGNPVTTAPIVSGKPVEAPPTAPSHPVILEKGSGGDSGKH